MTRGKPSKQGQFKVGNIEGTDPLTRVILNGVKNHYPYHSVGGQEPLPKRLRPRSDSSLRLRMTRVSGPLSSTLSTLNKP